MKHVSLLLLLCVGLVAVVYSPSPAAAAHSTDVAAWGECEGPVSVWRENELTEGGTVAGFVEAAQDHQAWLEAKGHEVQIRSWTAFELPESDGPDEERRATRRVAFGSEVVYPSFDAFTKVSSSREEEIDEAYDAFVAKYRKNTTIKATRLLCLSE